VAGRVKFVDCESVGNSYRPENDRRRFRPRTSSFPLVCMRRSTPGHGFRSYLTLRQPCAIGQLIMSCFENIAGQRGICELWEGTSGCWASGVLCLFQYGSPTTFEKILRLNCWPRKIQHPLSSFSECTPESTDYFRFDGGCARAKRGQTTLPRAPRAHSRHWGLEEYSAAAASLTAASR
jgi:hypothetical protein